MRIFDKDRLFGDGVSQTSQQLRVWIFEMLSVGYLLLIIGIPGAMAWFGLTCTPPPFRVVFRVLAVPAFAILYPLVAGVLSLSHRRYIVAGRFRRDLGTRLYFHRRLYGLCWTAVYYNTPIYWLVLSNSLLKRLVFRLFGYKGQMNFTVYPDTWIRDLPLLDFGEGAYIANRATLGTNMPERKGTILVGPISVGANSCVGHLSMLGPGVRVGDNVEVGVDCAIGMNTTLADGARIGPKSGLEHGITVGKSALVGAWVLIGTKADIRPGAVVPHGSQVRSRVVVGRGSILHPPPEPAPDRTSFLHEAQSAAN